MPATLLQTVGLATLVMFAAFGGLPTPPKFFEWLSDNVPFFRKTFQLLFYSFLVYLALGRENPRNTLIVSVIVFVVFEAIKAIERLYFP